MPLIEHSCRLKPVTPCKSSTIAADRDTLTRRRWRGSALDGTDFAFALTDPVRHGSVIFEGQGKALPGAADAGACAGGASAR